MNTLKFGNGEWYGKKDTILAYNDENSNFKPLPFSFDRASSATVVNKQGLIETVGSGKPRIDFSNDAKGALLLEPQTTQIVTYSEDFSNASWSKSLVTIESGYLAPDGTLNAFKVSSGGGSLTTNPPTLQTTTRTIYARTVSGTGTAQLLSHNSNTNNIFTLTEQWQRFDLNASGGTGFSTFYAVDFRGSGTLSEVILWGANATNDQSYATSYIPTQGGVVTRVADGCTNGGNEQVINSTEGVFYFEGSALSNDNSDRKITLSDGSLNNAINFGFSRFSGNINAEVKSGGVLQTSGFGATGITQDNNNKFALSWGGGVSKFYVNGTLASSYTNVTSPIGMNVLNFSLSSGFHKMFLNTKDLRVYNTALTDQELINLTTI